MSSRLVRKVTVCGFGLIGGSIALDLQRRCGKLEIFAYDRPSVLSRLKKDKRFRVKTMSAFTKAVSDADLIILSASHSANKNMLSRIASHKAVQDCLIIDTGAVKHSIAKLARSLNFKSEVQFMPSHPMSGKERKGFGSSESNIFKDHAWFFDDSNQLTEKNKKRLDWLISKTGSIRVLLDSELHDELVSEISHLPQMISTLLGAQVNPELIELAGPGLRSMLRLSGSPYDVWSEIIDENRLKIIDALELYVENMNRTISLIRKRESLKDIFDSASRSYKCLS